MHAASWHTTRSVAGEYSVSGWEGLAFNASCVSSKNFPRHTPRLTLCWHLRRSLRCSDYTLAGISIAIVVDISQRPWRNRNHRSIGDKPQSATLHNSARSTPHCRHRFQPKLLPLPPPSTQAAAATLPPSLETTKAQRHLEFPNHQATTARYDVVQEPLAAKAPGRVRRWRWQAQE